MSGDRLEVSWSSDRRAPQEFARCFAEEIGALRGVAQLLVVRVRGQGQDASLFPAEDLPLADQVPS
ncbi:MAG: hypothetical protein ABI540_02315 [Spartobacteria bacterium]